MNKVDVLATGNLETYSLRRLWGRCLQVLEAYGVVSFLTMLIKQDLGQEA